MNKFEASFSLATAAAVLRPAQDQFASAVLRPAQDQIASAVLRPAQDIK